MRIAILPIPVSVVTDPVDTKFDEAIAIHVTLSSSPLSGVDS